MSKNARRRIVLVILVLALVAIVYERLVPSGYDPAVSLPSEGGDTPPPEGRETR